MESHNIPTKVKFKPLKKTATVSLFKFRLWW